MHHTSVLLVGITLFTYFACWLIWVCPQKLTHLLHTAHRSFPPIKRLMSFQSSSKLIFSSFCILSVISSAWGNMFLNKHPVHIVTLNISLLICLVWGVFLQFPNIYLKRLNAVFECNPIILFTLLHLWSQSASSRIAVSSCWMTLLFKLNLNHEKTKKWTNVTINISKAVTQLFK